MSRFLLLSAGMGAGHDAVAAELARRLRAAGHESSQRDVLEMLPGRIGAGVRGFYRAAVGHAPVVYAGIYAAFFRTGPGPRPGSSPLAALAESRLQAEVAREGADAVVAVFHLAAQLTGRMRGAGRLPVPAAVVVTDFAVHRQWLHPGNDLNLCLTADIARGVRKRMRLPAAACGPLLPDRFHPHPAGADRWRRRFGDDGLRPPVLLATGAWGVGSRLDATARLLYDGGYLPVALCGRNERLRRTMAKVPGTLALGWVQDMPGLMAASTALIDNAAGQTAMEALAVGLPVVGHRPIPGHGADGVRTMAALGLTEYAADSWQLLQALDRITACGPGARGPSADHRLPDGDAVGLLDRLIAGGRA
ncbi:MGDG synthase family glycosyltransferase [Actinacidiphila acididurans]|uniref:Galactosyldiacylglycerol synthase n=1 Tax=Actinacidiphila acididurans TaxID=2784346 RepID=A0ABS2TS58_9ACTN|nr:galactosyldiacylglycerol synthase [Actinacidiphila acididurans]MBM9506166.1 galactosyldiacylglycerol synthase [Actinacidiphila acididurans]